MFRGSGSLFARAGCRPAAGFGCLWGVPLQELCSRAEVLQLSSDRGEFQAEGTYSSLCLS